MMALVGKFFGFFMYHCYRLLQDYGLSIVLFTLITKIILLPVSIMVQKNSIKMVQMYPELNRIRTKCFGNRDMISEEQYKLYKKNHYHPMLDLVPVIAQLVILMGVIDVIYRPLTYLLRMGQEQIDAALATFSGLTGISVDVSSIQIQLISWLHQGNTEAMDQVDTMLSLDLHFCGFDLGLIPWEAGGISLLVPLLAAASSWLMCFTQNRANVLQSEQSRANQWTTLLISVGLSLYLGLFVPAGVGFYWTVSNLFSIAQMYLLNCFIDPKKYIDYAALEESRCELERMKALASGQKKRRSAQETAREVADYKRFLAYPAKQIIFYSEKNGFYKYYKDVIETILAHSDVVIHYITSDPEDAVFSLASEQFRVYYIGENRLIVLMLKMDADIVVLTTPDLQKYHLKRSLVRDDIEYVYMDHAVASANLTLRKHALDAFDTIFATNEKMAQEIREMERVYSLPKKTILKYGYSLIDNMIAAYSPEDADVMQPEILIAPSWQEDNLMDNCIGELLDALGDGRYHITVRPHPQYVRHFSEKLKVLAEKYRDNPCIELQTDFSSNRTVFEADVLITDWSGIAYEYAFTTLKPVLFINTPMKVMNPDYREIDVVPFDIEARDRVGISVDPFDIEARDRVGISVDPDSLDTLQAAVQRLLTEEIYSAESLREVRQQYLYHVGESAEVGARYLLARLLERQAQEAAETAVREHAGTKEEIKEKDGTTAKKTDRQIRMALWRKRYFRSATVLAFPVIMVWILGPLEIFAGNAGELFFGTGDFLWMFLAASLAAVAAGALVLSFLPEKLRHFLHTLVFAFSMCFYLQNLVLNQELIKSDGSKMDWLLYDSYANVTICVWIIVIYTVFSFMIPALRFHPVIPTVYVGFFILLTLRNDVDNSRKIAACIMISVLCLILIWIRQLFGSEAWKMAANAEDEQTEKPDNTAAEQKVQKVQPDRKMQGSLTRWIKGEDAPERVLVALSAFFVLIQTVATFGLLLSNPYSVRKEKMYTVSSDREFSVAPGKNIIVLILDRYGNKAYENMMEDVPETRETLKDFTYYNNANTAYNYTFPSLTFMLTKVEPDVTLTVDRYKEVAWTQGKTRKFYKELHKYGYTYNLYTGSGSAIYRDAYYLKDNVDNVEEMDDLSYAINYGYMFYIMTKSSLLKYAPYQLKPYLEIQSFYYDGIVSFNGIDVCVSDNGEYYEVLRDRGLSIDPWMENALIITHLNGIHNPLTIDENAASVPADSVNLRQVQLGLDVILREYLQQLKDLGVYDDASIIITADHGQYLDTLDLQPIFFIKTPGQVQEEMTVNSAPISTEDFLPTILKLVGSDDTWSRNDFFWFEPGYTRLMSTSGRSIFAWHPDSVRERTTAYLNDGLDVYSYRGDREDLTNAVEAGNFIHIQATEDWD